MPAMGASIGGVSNGKGVRRLAVRLRTVYSVFCMLNSIHEVTMCVCVSDCG